MLNAKERWVAAGPDATTLQSQDKGNPVSVIYPEDGSLLMVSMTGIPKNAPSPNAAKLFIEFLLSKEAAEVQVKDRAQSVIKGVRPLPGGKAMDEIKLLRPSEDEIAKGIPAVKEKFRDTFGI
jgi:iron(III) transport system substrate-binding protein